MPFNTFLLGTRRGCFDIRRFIPARRLLQRHPTGFVQELQWFRHLWLTTRDSSERSRISDSIFRITRETAVVTLIKRCRKLLMNNIRQPTYSSSAGFSPIGSDTSSAQKIRRLSRTERTEKLMRTQTGRGNCKSMCIGVK